MAEIPLEPSDSWWTLCKHRMKCIRCLWDMRLHGSLCDVELVSNDGCSFKAHLPVIMAAWEHPNRLERMDELSFHTTRLTMKRLNAEHVKQILSYAYGRTYVNAEQTCNSNILEILSEIVFEVLKNSFGKKQMENASTQTEPINVTDDEDLSFDTREKLIKTGRKIINTWCSENEHFINTKNEENLSDQKTFDKKLTLVESDNWINMDMDTELNSASLPGCGFNNMESELPEYPDTIYTERIRTTLNNSTTTNQSKLPTIYAIDLSKVKKETHEWQSTMTISKEASNTGLVDNESVEKDLLVKMKVDTQMEGNTVTIDIYGKRSTRDQNSSMAHVQMPYIDLGIVKKEPLSLSLEENNINENNHQSTLNTSNDTLNDRHEDNSYMFNATDFHSVKMEETEVTLPEKSLNCHPWPPVPSQNTCNKTYSESTSAHSDSDHCCESLGDSETVDLTPILPSTSVTQSPAGKRKNMFRQRRKKRSFSKVRKPSQEYKEKSIDLKKPEMKYRKLLPKVNEMYIFSSNDKEQHGKIYSITPVKLFINKRINEQNVITSDSMELDITELAPKVATCFPLISSNDTTVDAISVGNLLSDAGGKQQAETLTLSQLENSSASRTMQEVPQYSQICTVSSQSSRYDASKSALFGASSAMPQLQLAPMQASPCASTLQTIPPVCVTQMMLDQTNFQHPTASLLPQTSNIQAIYVPKLALPRVEKGSAKKRGRPKRKATVSQILSNVNTAEQHNDNKQVLFQIPIQTHTCGLLQEKLLSETIDPKKECCLVLTPVNSNNHESANLGLFPEKINNSMVPKIELETSDDLKSVPNEISPTITIAPILFATDACTNNRSGDDEFVIEPQSKDALPQNMSQFFKSASLDSLCIRHSSNMKRPILTETSLANPNGPLIKTFNFQDVPFDKVDTRGMKLTTEDINPKLKAENLSKLKQLLLSKNKSFNHSKTLISDGNEGFSKRESTDGESQNVKLGNSKRNICSLPSTNFVDLGKAKTTDPPKFILNPLKYKAVNLNFNEDSNIKASTKESITLSPPKNIKQDQNKSEEKKTKINRRSCKRIGAIFKGLLSKQNDRLAKKRGPYRFNRIGSFTDGAGCPVSTLSGNKNNTVKPILQYLKKTNASGSSHAKSLGFSDADAQNIENRDTSVSDNVTCENSPEKTPTDVIMIDSDEELTVDCARQYDVEKYSEKLRKPGEDVDLNSGANAEVSTVLSLQLYVDQSGCPVYGPNDNVDLLKGKRVVEEAGKRYLFNCKGLKRKNFSGMYNRENFVPIAPKPQTQNLPQVIQMPEHQGAAWYQQ